MATESDNLMTQEAQDGMEPALAHRYQMRRVPSGALQLNLVAMIDIVFLLLMYFLLSANFVTDEELYRLNLPAPLGEQVSDPFELPDEPLVITVASTGPTWGDYALTMGSVSEPIDTFDDLYRTLTSAMARPGSNDGFLLPDTPILIQPRYDARWEHAVEAFNIGLRAGYEQVQMVEPGMP
ncbi:MAG: biopolymer transporter ExbD [Planctomycetes bacterium]|nr:biopolymer transporter ExbD [Planctomycetota bacterium]NOG55950.1 biopolymer transporter ExbD [Planctomycetota bacterium]